MRIRATPPVVAVKVARVLGSFFPWLDTVGVTSAAEEVNGQPGAILRDSAGRVLYVVILGVLEGQVQTVRRIANPDKLDHLGPVADVWALDRELRAARRRR